MVNVLLNNDDLTVLGPPETVEVLVDIGPSGTRGSQVFVGSGNPNITPPGQTALLNDLYLNIAPGDEYSYLYQYIAQPGANTWSAILKMNPTLYSSTKKANFTSGDASITIAISEIINITGIPLTAENFNVQYSINNLNPVAASIQIPELVDPDYLVINLHAVKYESSTWSVLTGEVDVNLFISIM